eukprot:5213561-Pyramimonas_sp.AAC.1
MVPRSAPRKGQRQSASGQANERAPIRPHCEQSCAHLVGRQPPGGLRRKDWGGLSPFGGLLCQTGPRIKPD